jgi:alcohol dehydrogenase (cytochrome c)
MLERGGRLYAAHCAGCHGADGRGPEHPSGRGVPDLSRAGVMDALTDMDVARVVEHGGPTMPPNGGVRGDDLVATTAFVRSLSRPGVLVVEAQAIAQGTVAGYTPVTDEMLAHPPAHDWLMIGRTYDAWSFSPLDQIDRTSVSRLQLAWSRAMAPGGQYTTPIVHDGVVYVANSNDAIQALDGRTGDLIWEYDYLSPSSVVAASPEDRRGDGRAGAAERNPRNMAIYGDRVFHVTHDAHVIALDARTGALAWNTAEAPGLRGIGHMGGPLVAGGKVIVGHSASPTLGPTGGFIAAYDARSGAELWRRFLIPKPGEPGDETWAGLPYEQRRHVAAWGVGSYDPDTRLVYWGSSVPAPSLELVRGTPGGSDLYSNCTLALDADTGRIVWYYQHLPRDNWDLDHVFERYVIDTVVAPDPAAVRWISRSLRPGGRRRVVTGIPGKTGIIYTLDARTGEFLWARETIHQNVVADIDTADRGRVTINESLIARPFQETFVCPSLGGGKNWPSGAYSPLTRTMYQPQQNLCMRLTGNTATPAPEDGYATSWIIVPDPAVSGEPYPVGRLDAVSMETGRTVWLHQQRAGMLGSLVATAGGLVFGGDIDRRFTAFDDRNGRILWQTIVTGPVSGHPVAYEIDKREYIAVPVGGNTASPERRALSIHSEIKPPLGGNALFVFALAAAPAHDPAPGWTAIALAGVAAAVVACVGAVRYRQSRGRISHAG